MLDEPTYTSGSYRMEMLKGNNWMPWKRRMLAVLRDLALETYIDKDSKPPQPTDANKITDTEKEAAKKWREGEPRLELASSLPLEIQRWYTLLVQQVQLKCGNNLP
jgi:hypothetical protein